MAAVHFHLTSCLHGHLAPCGGTLCTAQTLQHRKQQFQQAETHERYIRQAANTTHCLQPLAAVLCSQRRPGARSGTLVHCRAAAGCGSGSAASTVPVRMKPCP